MKQKLTKRLLYWQKLSDLLMLLHFVTRFIRTSTVHNTTQSSFTQSLSKWKTKCHRGPTTRYGMRLQAVTQQSRKTIIDQRIAARQTCCCTYCFFIDCEQKNEILNCKEYNYWFYHINLGHIKLVREGFSGDTRAAFLSYSKSFVNSFLRYNSFVCYANVANSFMCYIYLKYIWANYVLLKPGVYTPILKKHQVVRDLKKFENHWSTWNPLSKHK